MKWQGVLLLPVGWMQGHRKGTFHLVSLNPLTPKILLVIFLTVWHTIIVIFVENLVLDHFIIPHLIFFPDPITCLLDIVQPFTQIHHSQEQWPTSWLLSAHVLQGSLSTALSSFFSKYPEQAGKKRKKEMNLIQWVCQPWTCTNCI